MLSAENARQCAWMLRRWTACAYGAQVWDLRKKGCLYTIPAHTSLVSNVRFERSSGWYLLTAGYDNVAKVRLVPLCCNSLPVGPVGVAGWHSNARSVPAQ